MSRTRGVVGGLQCQSALPAPARKRPLINDTWLGLGPLEAFGNGSLGPCWWDDGRRYLPTGGRATSGRGVGDQWAGPGEASSMSMGGIIHVSGLAYEQIKLLASLPDPMHIIFLDTGIREPCQLVVTLSFISVIRD